MLLSKQIHKVDDRSQAQERLLVKVVQQNEETVEILRRVEEVVVGIAAGMKGGFEDIRRELSVTNVEGLEEVKELWIKKMADLDKAIATSGENSTKLIENQMKKLDAMFTAKLFDLDVPSEGIKAELQTIQKQLLEANIGRLNGEKNAEQRLVTIMTELKSLQTQLDRVEEMTTRIFTTMERGFGDIRKELLENANHEGLQELRELWLRKMNDLEKTLVMNGSNNSNGVELFEKQLKKMEMMINAKLLDLDLSISSISPQLNEVKQQLQEVLQGVHQGEENSQKKMDEMISELRGLQTELVEVIRLQSENSKNLAEVQSLSAIGQPSLTFSLLQGLVMIKNCIVNVNSRTCPTTFILIPVPRPSDDENKKKGFIKHLSTIHQTITSPRESLMNLLQDKYYLILICEVCRQHPDDQDLWYLIDKPKEIVGKILPLARAGLQFASAVNKLSSLGRIFGLPTPVLSDATFSDGIDFLNELESGTLSDYSELERVAMENYQNQEGTSSKGVSSGEAGYCVREFSLFLSKIDPAKRWAHLSSRVNEKGDLCYVCPRCLTEAASFP
jgi:hypothetical protein